MNHIYRLKRSARTLQLLPVPETARNASKGASGVGKTLGAIVSNTLATFALSGIASLLHAQQAPPAVNQLPQGGVVTRGVANINTSTTSAGNALMTVNQSSQRAVIDWNSFNVGSQAKVQFNQPGSNAVVLNQILGNNASQIYGQISANGQVFLSNPNGVYFSPTAQVNVGGLVATTGKANVDDFMAGNTSFSRQGATGSVVNDGQLNAALGGYIALLAPEVRNQGVVVAQAGTVALASGEAITLNFNNSNTGLAGITTTPQTIAALVENRSAVLAEGGQIILSAHALASLQGSIVKNSGQLSASSLSDKGGKIVLMADSIELTGTSQIQANGATGGGTVLVGGDWQGSGDTRQATKVSMAQGASIEANATQNGDGGKVVLWSDVSNANSLTQVNGRIEAKGAGTGNGGQVETSGHTLQVGEQVTVNTQAAGQGKSGQWLLDPADITISSSAEAGATNSGGSYTPDSGVATSVVNATTLQTALNSGNVTVSTTNTGTAGSGTGNITVSSNLTWAAANVLTLQAAGGISASASTGNISMTSTTAGAGVVFNQAGNSTYSGIISGNSTANATLTKSGAGTLTLSGATNGYLTTTISGGILKLGSTTALGTGTNGSVTVMSGAALDLNGFSQVAANAKSLTISGTGVSNSGALMNSSSSATAATYAGLLSLGADASIIAGSTSGIILSNVGTVTGSGFNLTLGGTATTSAITSIIGTGSGTLTKQGTGTWTLNGANTYTGSTTIAGGTLTLGHVDALGSGTSGGVTVNDGAALDLGGSKVIAVLKPLTLNGTGVSNGGALTSFGGSTYSGLVTLGSDTLISGPVILSNTGTITGDGKTLTLGGSSGGTLYSILGTGSGGLIKQGTGIWGLRAANTYSGTTTVNGGTLMIYHAGALGSTASGTTVNTNGTLGFTNFVTDAPENLTLNGGKISNGGNTSLLGNVYLAVDTTFTSGGSLTINGNISGPGGIIKDSASTMQLVLAGNNSYTGATSVMAGSLKLGSVTALGATPQITVSGSGYLQMNGYSVNTAIPLSINDTGVGTLALTNLGTTPVTYAGLVSIVGTAYIGTTSSGIGAITLSNTGTITGTGTPVLGLSGNGVLNSVIGSTITDLTKTVFGGTWVLTRDNTHLGSITISEGTLQIGNGTGSTSLPAGTSISIGASATLAYNVPGGAVLTNPITFATSTSTIANLAYGSVLDLSGVPFTYTGTGGTFSPSVNEAVSTPTVAKIVLPDSPDLGKARFNVITSGSMLSFSSIPVVTWSGASTGTALGRLLNGVTNSPGFGEQLTVNPNDLSIASGAIWSLTNNGPTTYYYTTTDTVSASWAASGTREVTVVAGASVTNNGVFSGSSAWTLKGGGTLTLSGSNNYSGLATVSAGSTLKAGSANAFGTGAISVSSGAVLDLNGQAITGAGNLTLNGTGVNNGGALMNSGGAATYPGLVLLGASSSIMGGSGTIALTNIGTTTGSGRNLTLGGAAGGSFAGVIGNTTGSVTKQDAGTWVLSGSNTYTGGNFINGGTLQISSDANLGAVPGSAAINITINGGTLNVSGQSAAVPLSANRLISIGTSGGTITNGSSSFGLTINGGITSSGAVTLNGGDLTFGNITVSNNSAILVKSTGNITQSASSTVTSAGGNITYWADSDGSDAGGITLTAGTSLSNTKISSTNGTIVLGGGNGASASLGYARGDRGVLLQSYTQILGSNITIKGAGNTSASSDAGVYLDTNSLVSGDTVTVVGLGYANSTAGGTGVTDAGTISATTLASITGTGTGTAVTTLGSGIANYGIVFSSATVEATGSGNVVINGTGGGDSSSTSINYGVIMSATTGLSSSIRSATGTVTVNATGGGGTTNTGFVTTTTGTGTVTIGGTGQAGAITLNTNSMSQLGGIFSTPSLLILGSGSSNISLPLANVIGTVAGSGLGNVNINNAGALTVGTVGTTHGLSASGTVTVTTSTGNLTLTNTVTTTNATASAIALDAGKTAIVGDTTSGNLILSGGSVSTGAGGLAMLYTGSVADSTGVTALVSSGLSMGSGSLMGSGSSMGSGSGSGNFRYGSTIGVTNYSTALGTSGVYAIYRERPTVSWSGTSSQSLAYGVSPVIDTTAALSGLVNGDTVNATMAVRVSGTNALATLNASGYYDVGNYVFSRTLGAKALGYLTTDPTLTVTRAALTVTANNATKTYDGLAFTGGNGVSYAGLVTGETAANLGGSVSYTGTAQGAINATNGTPYTIIPSGLTSSNYAISYVNGGLTVNRASLTVTINNDARFLSETDAVGFGGASYSGFVAGQTSAVLGGALSVTRSASGPDGNTGGANTLAGTYTGALSGTGLTSSNYTIGYVPGNYTIVPANQLLVVLASTSANYGSTPIYSVTSAKYYHTGSAPVDLTSSVVLSGTSFTLNDGFNGNTAFTLGALSPSLSTSGNLNVGAYQLGATSISNTNGNYSNNLTVTGALQVNPKAITAAVTSGASKAYDGNNSMSGLALGLTGLMTNDVVTASGAGTFASKDVASPLAYSVANIALAGAAASNYVLTDSVSHLPSNTLTGTNGAIAAVQLTITGALQGTVSKVYDGTDVATLSSSNYLLTGWIGSDGATVTKTSGTYSDKNVSGSKTVTVSLSSSDYTATGSTALSNYVLPTSITGAVGTITRLSQVTWVGGSTGNWFDPANWAGGAVPDLSNVANVVIPTGVTVSFSNTVVAPAQAGAVNLVSIGTGGSLAISAGTLNVGSGGVALNTLTQTGGALSSTGDIAVANLSQTAGTLSAASLSTTTSFSQTGSGTITATGDIALGATNAPVTLGNLSTTGALSVTSTGGAIAQNAGTSMSVAGTSTFLASNLGAPADVTLANSGNTLIGTVTINGVTSGSGSSNASADPAPPAPGMTPNFVMSAPSYRVVMVKSPLDKDGLLRIEWVDALADTEIELPTALQEWIKLAQPVVKAGANGKNLPTGIKLSDDGSSLKLLATADLRLPANVVLQGKQGAMKIQVVKAH